MIMKVKIVYVHEVLFYTFINLIKNSVFNCCFMKIKVKLDLVKSKQNFDMMNIKNLENEDFLGFLTF